MANSIVVVTPPDDILQDGYRILCVGLEVDESQIVSDIVKESKHNNIIIYIADILDPTWVIDKKQKSDLIVFNANMEDRTLVGYLAAQGNSFYFGTLKTIAYANNRAIYTGDQLLTFMEDDKSSNE